MLPTHATKIQLLLAEATQAFSYTNWGGIEPNNSGYAYMLIGDHPRTDLNPGHWMDDSADGGQGTPSGDDPVIGYFVEYEATGLIPTPHPLLLLLGGVWGLLRIGR